MTSILHCLTYLLFLCFLFAQPFTCPVKVSPHSLPSKGVGTWGKFKKAVEENATPFNMAKVEAAGYNYVLSNVAADHYTEW